MSIYFTQQRIQWDFEYRECGIGAQKTLVPQKKIVKNIWKICYQRFILTLNKSFLLIQLFSIYLYTPFRFK